MGLLFLFTVQPLGVLSSTNLKWSVGSQLQTNEIQQIWSYQGNFRLCFCLFWVSRKIRSLYRPAYCTYSTYKRHFPQHSIGLWWEGVASSSTVNSMKHKIKVIDAAFGALPSSITDNMKANETKGTFEQFHID